MKYYCIKQHDITDCGAACLAILCAPASVLVGGAYVGACICSAAVDAGAGMMIGQGIIRWEQSIFSALTFNEV